MGARNSQIGMLAVTAAFGVGCISSLPPPPTAEELEGDDDGTVVEVWSQTLVGATVTVGGESAVVDEGGVARLALHPGLRGTSVEVTLTRDGATLHLETRWADDFALTQTDPRTRTDALVLQVMRAPDGQCTLTRPMLDAGGVTRTESLPRDWVDGACEGWRLPTLPR